jgi:hypothetical protein
LDHLTQRASYFVIISAADANEDQLRLLDDALLQDLPGTAG